tara:strand:+ start:116 stop:310 length:195 start_codon:yes stop_codon:yes gene_type:complete
MAEPDLIEQRQYAERILRNVNIRPLRVNLLTGLAEVEERQLALLAGLVNQMNLPLHPAVLTDRR